MPKINSKKSIIKCKILCVDDEQVILDALTRLFRHVGYQHVLTAHSGELGLGILENNQDTDVIRTLHRIQVAAVELEGLLGKVAMGLGQDKRLCAGPSCVPQ